MKSRMPYSNQTVIPRGSRVLVTGANGYIASHIINVLLECGYLVRGTTREPKPWLHDYFEQRYGPGRFEIDLVPDFQEPDAFYRSVEGTAGVIHVAQAMPSASDTKEAVAYTVAGTVNLLKAAAAYPSVKRVVLTSSIVAAGYPSGKGFRYDTDSWDNSSLCQDQQRAVYRACKTEGERQAWKWVEENRPGFELNTVLPWFTVGRILHPSIGGSTMDWVTGLLNGNNFPFKILPLPWFVDVQDTARLHVIALLSSNVKSERLFAATSPFTWADVIRILRSIQPHNKCIPDPPEHEELTSGEVIPAARAEKLLCDFFGQKGWTTLEGSLASGIERGS